MFFPSYFLRELRTKLKGRKDQFDRVFWTKEFIFLMTFVKY